MVLLRLLLELGRLYLILMTRVVVPGNNLGRLGTRSIRLLDGLASHDDILVVALGLICLALCKIGTLFLRLGLEAPMI